VITAVDTSVLLDVLKADDQFGPRSRDALSGCAQQGQLIACDVVWAETSAWFDSAEAAASVLDRLGVVYSSIGVDAALSAGDAWRIYRRRGGTRKRVVADFLIAGHAMNQADRLLTRDRGFYRESFSELEILDPSTD
jgi:predicted nucleic acid-binding protein